MLKNNDCYFCMEIEDHAKNLLNKNRIVYETKNFIALPTVGCFKIGYLLVIPKEHYLCFGELDDTLREELENLIEKITTHIKKVFGMGCIIFEHGTRDMSHMTATSIMHAHIHIIPFENDLISYLPDYCELKKIRGFVDLVNEKENYLFIKDVSNNNYIVKYNNYPSQFFRQVICKAMGVEKYWNWREYKFIENMEITIDYFRDL